MGRLASVALPVVPRFLLLAASGYVRDRLVERPGAGQEVFQHEGTEQIR